jgi:spore coat polysaccharide biosynthesis protein SpsF
LPSHKVVSIILARSDSVRLPSKHLLSVRGRTMLSYLIERVNNIPEVNETIVATTDRICDIEIVREALLYGAKVYKGSLHDVVGRFYDAATEFEADIVVKTNGDNPLQAPEVITRGIEQLIDGNFDIVTGKNLYTGLPVGIGSEVLTYQAISKVNTLSSGIFRNDPTNYIFSNLNEFEWSPIYVDKKWTDSNYSITVDTAQDFTLFKKVVESLPDTNPASWTINEILELIKIHG